MRHALVVALAVLIVGTSSLSHATGMPVHDEVNYLQLVLQLKKLKATYDHLKHEALYYRGIQLKDNFQALLKMSITGQCGYTEPWKIVTQTGKKADAALDQITSEIQDLFCSTQWPTADLQHAANRLRISDDLTRHAFASAGAARGNAIHNDDNLALLLKLVANSSEDANTTKAQLQKIAAGTTVQANQMRELSTTLISLTELMALQQTTYREELAFTIETELARQRFYRAKGLNPGSCQSCGR